MEANFSLTNVDWKATGLGIAAMAAFIFLILSVTFGSLTILPRLWIGDTQPM
jgi:hypothetical protein